MAINFEGHLRQIQDFIDGIREQRPFFIEGREARKAVALVRAIYDSAASGKPVRPVRRESVADLVKRSRGLRAHSRASGMFFACMPSSTSVPPCGSAISGS